mmetsp:Transcript_3424/g.8700  ORF Transcript_3424/g.8700 Transcript_3424/m.8700 type:complete len:463 (+) Transcript_3424:3-1391(+)
MASALKARRSAALKNKSTIYRHRHLDWAPGSSSVPLGTGMGTSDIFENEYSPIRPRVRKRRSIIAPYPTPIYLQKSPLHLEEAPPLHDPPTSLFSPPFSFWPKTGPNQQSNSNRPHTIEHIMMPKSSTHWSPAYIVECFFGFVAQWLRSWRSIVEDNGANLDLSSPQSLPSPIPSSPHSNPVNYRPISSFGSTEKGFAHPRSLLGRGAPATLQLPTTSNRAFLSANKKPVNPNMQPFKDIASGQGLNGNCVKNSSCIHPGPPNGWEGLFQPKAGEWKCQTCFYINPVDAMSCDSCTALKKMPGSVKSDAIINMEEVEVARINDNDCTANFAAIESQAAADGGTIGKRAKVSSLAELNADCNVGGNATQAGNRHSPELGCTTNTKRVKVDSAQASRGDSSHDRVAYSQNSPDAMSEDSPTSGSKKKRNISDDDDVNDLNQVSKLAREDFDESEIAMDDSIMEE